MHVVIPLCGKGSRFVNSPVIKPLIKVLGKEIILYALDSLFSDTNNTYDISIIINKNTNKTNIREVVNNKYPSVQFVDIIDETEGAVETVVKGLEKMHFTDVPLLIVDGDSFYKVDIVSLFREFGSNKSINAVSYFEDTGLLEQYSYIAFDNNSWITDIVEKQKISDNANTGAYYFGSTQQFIKYGREIINKNIRFKNEYYISAVIKRMLEDGCLFKGVKLNGYDHISLGTPEQVDEFTKDARGYLFDLDGTLVVSDHIYRDFWRELLAQYNITLDDDFFNSHIQGHSDQSVVNKLLAGCNIDAKKLSLQKDLYFCSKVAEIGVISGAAEFIKNLKHISTKNCVAVVTNCNRISAKTVIKSLGLTEFVDLLVIGDECEFSKPHPEPYLTAIKHFGLQTNRYIAFEDSKTGIISAVKSGAHVVGITSHIGDGILKGYGASFTVRDYCDGGLIDLVNSVLNRNGSEGTDVCEVAKMTKYERYIFDSLQQKYPELKSVKLNPDNIRGGYICDILKGMLVFNDKNIPIIFKIQNENGGSLTDMAVLLNLYDREYYFYETVSPYVNINIPYFYGIVRDYKLKRIGFILKDISSSDFVLNLDLNKQTIDVVLNLVSEIAKMHNHFANKNLTNVFKGLDRNNSAAFSPFCPRFIAEKLPHFIHRWGFLLNNKHKMMLTTIAEKYGAIQQKLSEGALTLCHGDFKSPNTFYKISGDGGNYTPYLIDWQYIVEGKGLQDVVFLLIESFEQVRINSIFDLVIHYYFEKTSVIYNGDRQEFNRDLAYSICYFPMLVAMWFGTIDVAELNDKNFPYFFIRKYLNVLDNHLDFKVIEEI